LLLADVRRQLITLHEIVPPAAVARGVPVIATAEQRRQRLREWLQGGWTERWQKALAKKRTPPVGLGSFPFLRVVSGQGRGVSAALAGSPLSTSR
jgi:hypothetical protein